MGEKPVTVSGRRKGMMFLKKKKQEQVAGFKHLHTGAFREEMLIQNDRELAAFKSRYGIDEIEKEY